MAVLCVTVLAGHAAFSDMGPTQQCFPLVLGKSQGAAGPDDCGHGEPGECVVAIGLRATLSLQVGFDPHPPMRATGLTSGLASIPGGKP